MFIEILQNHLRKPIKWGLGLLFRNTARLASPFSRRISKHYHLFSSYNTSAKSNPTTTQSFFANYPFKRGGGGSSIQITVFHIGATFVHFLSSCKKSSLLLNIYSGVKIEEMMIQQTQILEMSGLPKEEIANRIVQILNESEIERFTLLLKRNLLNNESKDRVNAIKIEQPIPRIKSKTIDRGIHTCKFALARKIYSVEAENGDMASTTGEDGYFTQLDQAQQSYAIGRYEDSLELLQQIRKQYEELDKSQIQKEQYRQILTNIADCNYQLKRFQESITTYKSVVALLKESGEQLQPQAAKIYNNLGSAYAHLGLEKLSMNAYSNAINIYQHYPEMDASSLFNNIANIYLNCKMYAAAEKYFSKAIVERKQKKPTQKELLYHGYKKLSQAQMSQKKFKEAEENLMKAQRLAENGIGCQAEIFKDSALLREKQQKWADALEFYEKLHIICEQKQKDTMSKGQIYEKASIIYKKLGKQAQHQKYLARAVQQYKSSGNM